LPRSPCPSGVGNFGFNSFNFLTFMVMTFNAVANVNNNINNNNNNNQDINLNSISQDSNSVVSNSDNMNTVMATILPVPGRKRRSIGCNIREKAVDLLRLLTTEISRLPHCTEYFVCRSLIDMQDIFSLQKVLTSEGEVLVSHNCPQKECSFLH